MSLALASKSIGHARENIRTTQLVCVLVRLHAKSSLGCATARSL